MAVHSTYEVRWKNFKGFKDTDWIKIKPITILIGPNNSGKTSFITPFLLMNQTLASRDFTSPLIVHGNLYDGGQLKDLIYNYDISKEIFFGFRYHVHEPEKKLRKVGTYPPGAFEVIVGCDKKHRESQKFTVRRQTIYDIYCREYLSLYKEDSDYYKISGLKLDASELEFVGKVTPINFLFSPNTFLDILAGERDANQEKRRFSKGYEELLRAISRNYTDARDVILDISYLGPLRDKPHRFYQITDEVYDTVGLKGENTPNLLKANINKKKVELNKWIKKFGFGDELVLKQLSAEELLYSINFRNNTLNFETNIANTGFGASQILPLIVQAITSRKESITIAEQPEIHLNPRLQGVLAELFADMAKKDQRVIVETHSEHLLLKLRTLIAEKELSPDLVAVYYVEKKEGNSIIREISMDDKGRVKTGEWPQGFFDDTLRQSLALASAQSRNKN